MTSLMHLMSRCLREEEGNELIEYALLLGLIVIGTIAIISSLGVKVLERWRDIVEAI